MDDVLKKMQGFDLTKFKEELGTVASLFMPECQVCIAYPAVHSASFKNVCIQPHPIFVILQVSYTFFISSFVASCSEKALALPAASPMRKACS